MAEQEQAAIEVLPLPEDLDALEERREQETTDAPLVTRYVIATRADAQRAAARVRYFRSEKAKAIADFDLEEQRLKAELERLYRRKAQAIAPWERREGWYLAELELYARMEHERDPKIKTITLPAADLVLRAQQPEWNYGEEKDLGKWLKANAPQFVKEEPVPIKTDFKKAVSVNKDGTVSLPDTGEIIPGVVVVERPPKFEIKD